MERKQISATIRTVNRIVEFIQSNDKAVSRTNISNSLNINQTYCASALKFLLVNNMVEVVEVSGNGQFYKISPKKDEK